MFPGGLFANNKKYVEHEAAYIIQYLFPSSNIVAIIYSHRILVSLCFTIYSVPARRDYDTEYHSVCSFVWIGFFHPLSTSECVSPSHLDPGRGHTRLRWGGGGGLEPIQTIGQVTLALCILCAQHYYRIVTCLQGQRTRAQSTYICRVQSSVWRLPKYWTPTALPPHQRRGGTHSPGGEVVGGQYFGRRQTLDWPLIV